MRGIRRSFFVFLHGFFVLPFSFSVLWMNMEEGSHYKTIFFDWHKILSTSPFWDQWKDPTHPRHEWYAPLSQHLLGENMPTVEKWMRGKMTAEDIARLLGNRLGYSPGIIFQNLKESCETMRFVSDDILPLIQRIRKSGTKCIIATDNMDAFRRYVVPALELEKYFDDFLVSFDRGLLKFDATLATPFRFLTPVWKRII